MNIVRLMLQHPIASICIILAIGCSSVLIIAAMNGLYPMLEITPPKAPP